MSFRERKANIGVTASMVTDYCQGRSWPRREIIEAIMRETGGQVTANDLLSDNAGASLDAEVP